MSENRTRFRLDQRRAPIYEALEQFRQMRVVPFDVPGHKRGRGNPELTAFLGQQCVGVDVNSMKPLDNLCHPVSVIREAEELAADAFGAAHAFLMVGGTTSSVQSMVLTVCKRGDEIILPRNVHRSVLNALVLCGAVPVYVNPEVDKRLGISLGMKREQVAKAIKEHPNAVAVLVNNPTYYGICSDLRAIVKMAHEAGMLCLADEAHGTHFYFGNGLPVSAMAAGADMASVSMHKSGGSLTQSSLLLIGPNVHQGYVRQIINLTQTTSGSYLLMSSLDISRRNLALRGRQVFHQVADMAEREGVEIKYYSIIYKAIEDIEASLKGMLKPEFEEVVTSHSEIREIFRSSKFGNIAGVMVQDGEVKRGTKCRILRNGIATVNDLEISSLRRFKDDVNSVKEGYEAGINLGSFNDIELGDVIETFEMQEIERK